MLMFLNDVRTWYMWDEEGGRQVPCWQSTLKNATLRIRPSGLLVHASPCIQKSYVIIQGMGLQINKVIEWGLTVTWEKLNSHLVPRRYVLLIFGLIAFALLLLPFSSDTHFILSKLWKLRSMYNQFCCVNHHTLRLSLQVAVFIPHTAAMANLQSFTASMAACVHRWLPPEGY